MGINAPDSRVNVLIRLVGLFFAGLGGLLTYLTYAESSASTLVPQIVPVFYLGSILLVIVGLIAAVAKYK